MMKQGLSLKLSQNLALTPQLQQAIKLLQMSQLELQEALIEQVENNPFLTLQAPQDAVRVSSTGALQVDTPAPDYTAAGMQDSYVKVDDSQSNQDSNPALDQALGAQWDDTSDTYSAASDGRGRDSNDSGDDNFEWVAAQSIGLLEHLQTQARLKRLEPATQAVLGALIEAVNPEGYLEASLPELQADVAQSLEVFQDDYFEQVFEQALGVLHSFDPPGVGAFNVQQSLLLQLNHPCAADCVLDVKVPVHRLAQTIVQDGFAALSQRDRPGLKRQFKCDDALLAQALDLIRQLDPKPGLAFAQDSTEYVQPEILVIKLQGAWQARLNPAVVPALRVQETHAKYLKRGVAQTEALYQQLQGAKQLVRTVQQHFETVFRVGQAIVAAQQAFFEHGAIKIKPMVLRDIADNLGLHESTVSRVTTRKYLQTPQGVFEMKYFFSSGLSGDDGENTSSTAIKAFLLELLKGEPPHKPHSDQALADALNERGYNVARRTVAKYREQLGYASAHARKPL